MSLPKKLSLDMMQDRWASELDPILRNILVNGLLVDNITIKSGANVINHRLGRKPQGYIIADINAAVTLYRSQPFNNLTLTLTSNGNATISLWVF